MFRLASESQCGLLHEWQVGATVALGGRSPGFHDQLDRVTGTARRPRRVRIDGVYNYRYIYLAVYKRHDPQACDNTTA